MLFNVGNVNDLVSNNLLYRMRDKCPELDKFEFRRGCLPLVFSTFPKSVTKALSIVRSPLVRLETTEIDKHRNAVIRPYSQPALISSYRNGFLVVSAAG